MKAEPVATGQSESGLCRRLASVVRVQRLGSLTWLVLFVPGWPGAKPGQFAMLQSERSRCFLARPFSVADQLEEQVSFLIAPVGEASRELCGSRTGEKVWVLGPLGNGFDLEAVTKDAQRIVLIGGGVGIAPFPLVLRNMRGAATERPLEVLVLLGFRDLAQSQAARLVRAAFDLSSRERIKGQVLAVREDDHRRRGVMVSDLARAHMRPGDRLLACGPLSMCRALWEMCRSIRDVKAWFSLESTMACGVGACHGCVITRVDGSFAQVCRQGPVFRGEEVFGG